MRCAITTCNLDSECATEEITFHPIPVKLSVRAEWLKVLNKDPSEVPNDSVVCSKHFLKGDLYINRSGLCRMRVGAVPVVNLQNLPINDEFEIQICRICFASQCKLYNMTEYENLNEAYTTLTGLKTENEDDLPPYLCCECTQRLLNCVQFRNRSLRAHLVLLDVVKRHENITLKTIRSIIGNDSPVGSQLTVSATHHYDLKMKYVKAENEGTDEPVDLTDDEVDIKIERDDVIDMNNPENISKEHEGHSIDLHEYYDIKTDADDSNGQDFDGEDTQDNTECLSNSNTDIINDTLDESDEGGDLLMTNETVNDGFNVNPILKRVMGTDENEDVYLLVKSSKTVKKSKKGAPAISQDNSTIYPPNDDYRLLTEKYIIKANNVKPNVVAPSEIIPTNIVKLRKLMVGDRFPGKNKYGKFPYQTISDVPVWGRLTRNTTVKPFRCNVCEFKTGYKKEFVLHMRTHGIDKPEALEVNFKTVKPFNCTMCHYKTTYKKEFMLHLKTHCDQDPDNDECAEMMSDLAGLSGPDGVTCDVCKQVFLSKTHLRKHKEVTSIGKPYSCDICKMQFKFNCLLHKHRRKHTGEKPYSCDVCKKSFIFQGSLYFHNKRYHSGESVSVKNDAVNKVLADVLIIKKKRSGKSLKNVRT